MNKKLIITVSLATLLFAGGTTGAIYSANEPAPVQQNQSGQMQAPDGMMNPQMQAPNGMMNPQMPMNDKMGSQGFGQDRDGNFDQGNGRDGRGHGKMDRYNHGKMDRGGHGKMDRGDHGRFEKGGYGDSNQLGMQGKDHRDFNGFWAGIFALLLIQALAIGGYFGYKSFKNRKNNTSPTPPDHGGTTQVIEEPVQNESAPTINNDQGTKDPENDASQNKDQDDHQQKS